MTRSLRCATLVCLATCWPGGAHATKFWKNSVTSGNWNTGNNWSAVSAAGADNGGVPIIGEPTRIVNTDGVARTVTLDINPPTLGLVSIDLTGAGTAANTLSLTSGNNLTSSALFVGGYNGTAPTNGRGTVTQSAGSVAMNAGTDMVVGHGAGSTGVYTLSGTGNLVANQSQYIGLNGTGVFNHSGGTNTINAGAVGAFDVGVFAGANGTYNLSGTGQLISNKSEYIGDQGTGVFNHTGGTNTISGSNNFYLGTNPGGAGYYELSAGSLSANNYQFIGYAGVGQFNQTGGSNTVANLIIADRATGQGSYAISGGTLAVGNNAQVGLLGTASMFITGTGSVNIAGDLAISNTSNVTLNGGTLRFNTISGLNRLIWQSGTLQLTGDRNLNGDSTLSYFFGPNPTILGGKKVVIEGASNVSSDSTFTVNGGGFTSLGMFRVGTQFSGQSTLNILNGATVVTPYTRLADAFGASSPSYRAIANVSGAGTTWNTGSLEIGRGGVATLNVTGGGSVVSSDIVIGFTNVPGNEPSIAVVSGPGSSLTSNSLLYVGYGGNGTLNIDNGGRVYVGTELHVDARSAVNLNGGIIRFDTFTRYDFDPAFRGQFNYAAGTVQLAGARTIGGDAIIQELYGTLPVIPTGKGLTVEGSATLTKPLTIAGGAFKTNGLTIGSGGVLDFDRGVLELTGGTLAGLAQLNIPTNGEFRAVGTQTIRVAGAVGSTITPTGLLVLGDFNAVNGFYTNGTVNVGAGTLALADANDAVFDSAALVTLGGSGPGQLDALNGLTLNFGANITGYGEVYTSNAIFTPLINNGHIIGTSPTQRISLPGYVKGVGTFDNVNFTGTFAPGLSPTSLIVGNVGFSNTSLLVMEIGGTSPGSSYDQIISSGALGLDGALQITLINGFTPLVGQSFNLLDWATVSGTFDTLVLPALGGGLSWNTSQLYTTGVLSVVSAGLPGDYNNNGTVDAADYTLYRDALGTNTTLPNDTTPGSVTVADYNVWQTNFGQGGPSAAAANSTAVPEPNALLLLLGAIGLRRRVRT